MKILSDTFGRKFPYIRLSITDVCNYKCTYCLPQGYKKIPVIIEVSCQLKKYQD